MILQEVIEYNLVNKTTLTTLRLIQYSGYLYFSTDGYAIYIFCVKIQKFNSYFISKQ